MRTNAYVAPVPSTAFLSDEGNHPGSEVHVEADESRKPHRNRSIDPSALCLESTIVLYFLLCEISYFHIFYLLLIQLYSEVWVLPAQKYFKNDKFWYCYDSIIRLWLTRWFASLQMGKNAVSIYVRYHYWYRKLSTNFTLERDVFLS